MNRPRRELIVITRADGVEVLAAPCPGRVHWTVPAGATIVPGCAVGQLVETERAYDLVLPAGVHGQVREIVSPHPWVRCGHGTPLAVLGAVEASAVGAPENDTSRRSAAWEVRAPSHGTFYRRPAPDAPDYVAPGAEIEAGAIIGLVEVMKCFSPIAFEPPAGVRRGRVRDVLAADGSEIQSDQVLARVELL